MALFNCWRGWRFFGSLGGHRKGPFSVPVICDKEDPKIHGCWSHGGWFTQGHCKACFCSSARTVWQQLSLLTKASWSSPGVMPRLVAPACAHKARAQQL
mmetsp:Transcript_65727/g.152711  ORF Transcript_65727/g.152711 Transcript_65727/m.152711 type:complete len:99 (+) Transcript_65727:301-597(+)